MHRITYCFANGVSARNTANVAHGEILYKWFIFSSDKCAKNSTNADDDDEEEEEEEDILGSFYSPRLRALFSSSLSLSSLSSSSSSVLCECVVEERHKTGLSTKMEKKKSEKNATSTKNQKIKKGEAPP